ncbi:MAG TPA: response regulator [Pirellulaceae bacterium]|nr:response regulator [Pirellulaceae bacterium]HMO93601.1 response regulator [Pirellulaceae bacterium]HMP70525.1 response regulator [Pirellulaceae bacterium]
MSTTFSSTISPHVPSDLGVGITAANGISQPVGSTVRQENAQNKVSTILYRSVERTKGAKIMIIDDEPLIIRVVRRFLQSSGYSRFIEITDAARAIDSIRLHRPDLILLDINMPGISGLDILRKRQELDEAIFTPVIILSADADAAIKHEALELGATEFLKKPVDPSDLILRVQNALIVKAHQDHLADQAISLERLVAQRTRELARSREQIIHCLARAAEFRDNETGEHVVRVGKYAAIIAQELGFDEEYCQKIELATQLHDVGKIAIPDAILMKPGKLEPDEMAIMMRHCELGLRMIGPVAETENEKSGDIGPSCESYASLPSQHTDLLKLAASIAATHHEKWDGTGYPHGLKGEEIPIEGRIATVADVFDALSTKRPYKSPFPLKRCLEIMKSECGTRFEPRVFMAFLRRFNDIIEVSKKHADIER